MKKQHYFYYSKFIDQVGEVAAQRSGVVEFEGESDPCKAFELLCDNLKKQGEERGFGERPIVLVFNRI